MWHSAQSIWNNCSIIASTLRCIMHGDNIEWAGSIRGWFDTFNLTGRPTRVIHYPISKSNNCFLFPDRHSAEPLLLSLGAMGIIVCMYVWFLFRSMCLFSIDNITLQNWIDRNFCRNVWYLTSMHLKVFKLHTGVSAIIYYLYFYFEILVLRCEIVLFIIRLYYLKFLHQNICHRFLRLLNTNPMSKNCFEI